MNKWLLESSAIVNGANYLDRLSAVYPMNINPERPIGAGLKADVSDAFAKKNDKKLIELLLNAAVFPVKDSYIGFIRADKTALDKNPKTVKRIAERLYSLGLEKLFKEAERPMETNRQLGQAFHQWLPKLGYPVLEEKDFERSKGISFLAGSDKTLRTYAEKKLGCKLNKGIDLLFKKNGKNYIGEAKFLTTPGGEQDRGFDDAFSFVNNKSGKAKRIAILDGYIWLTSKGGLHKKIISCEEDIFSALLLNKYIETI